MSYFNPFLHDEMYQHFASFHYNKMSVREYLSLMLLSEGFAKKGQRLFSSISRYQVSFCNIQEMFFMAKFRSIEFVNYELTAKQEKELIPLLDSEEYPLFEELGNLVTDGYRMSVSYSPNTKSFVASLTARDDAPDNTGMCLTSHGATAYDAMCCSLYKHYHIFAGGEWKSAEPQTRRIR